MSCIFPGCREEAKHTLGIRLRRPDTTAIWAPNTDACLCDRHATQGIAITILLEATNTGRVETRVLAGTPGRRDTDIAHNA